jgi:hypothetical protein
MDKTFPVVCGDVVGICVRMGLYTLFPGLSDVSECIPLLQNTVAGKGSRVAPVDSNMILWFLYCRNETDNMLMGLISQSLTWL